MDLKQILKEHGLTDEQIATVMASMKANGLHISGKENADAEIETLTKELEKLRADNETLKAGNAAGDTAQEEIRTLKEAIQKGRIETAAIIALTKERAADVDYLMYRAEKSGALDEIKVDGDGKVTGTEEFVARLKKDFTGQFEAGTKDGGQSFVRTGVKRLEDMKELTDEPVTLEEAVAQRLAEKEE